MWPFRDPVRTYERDLKTLFTLYQRIGQGAVANLGSVDGSLCRQFVRHYVRSRRRHGDRFIDFVRRTLISDWRADVANMTESVNRSLLVVAETRLTELLVSTQQCPEMEELWEYMLDQAKRVRAQRDQAKHRPNL